ncbi:inositol monophosphatase 1-like [Drosophila innubila]|uniref:inositol monophosphatase 1-like n=1 Tax=Drosophila innubila TaxID=198719 RepID=UPI00148E6987|nr:inositol monophosphatase 1-like [Drosophila innubila]
MQNLLKTVPQCLIRHISTVDREKACQLLSKLTENANELMLKSLTKSPEYTIKLNSRDFVTETDKAVERLLVNGIRKQFPDHIIIAEEGTEGVSKSKEITAAPTWIIDPIDGTMNFVHGFPHFCTSIALYVEKKAELAWISNPMLRHNYVAQRGKGVYFNGQPRRVSNQRDLRQSLIYLEWSLRRRQKDNVNVSMENKIKLLPLVHGIRSLGSAALNLAHVAIGACDAYVQFGPQVWDWAAGVLMVQEAGGVVIDPCGGEFDIQSQRLLAASTPELAEQFLPILIQMFPGDTKSTKPAKS